MPIAKSSKPPNLSEAKANITISLHIVCNLAYDLILRPYVQAQEQEPAS
jgi:hypothetical protein